MKVSVALCTFNGELYLAEQLKSILTQTYPVDEIVIGDDRSIDTTLKIVEEFQLSYPGIIKYIINGQQLGSLRNFEQIIQECSGEYIFLSDQDDLWNPDKVEVMVTCLEKNLHFDGCFSDAELVDEFGNSLKLTMWDSLGVKHDGKLMADESTLFRFTLMNYNVVTGAALAIRSSALPKIIPFNNKYKTEQHDEAIALKLSGEQALLPINKTLMKYRIHANQQVGTLSEEKRKSVKDFKYKAWKSGYSGVDLEVAIFEAWKYYIRAKMFCDKPSLEHYKVDAFKSFELVKSTYLNRMSFFKRKKALFSWYIRSDFETSFLQVITN